MTYRLPSSLLVFGTAALLGCETNPTVPNLADDLTAELEFVGDHLTTLTEIEVEVRVHTSDAGVFTDFSSIAVELRREGETEWAAVELSLHDDHFTAETMFFSSGDYEGRVVAQVTGSADLITLYETTEHLHVERIHQEIGDYVVEFETYPGHLHEGETIEVTFWVLEASTDGHGHGHAVGGLTPDIACTDADGTTEEHAAHEHEEGEYGAEHVLGDGDGTARFELHFMDSMGMDRHAEFSAPVSHGH